MKTKKMIRVKENNGGGITLYAVDCHGNEYAHTGYEYNPDKLLKDIYKILINDEDTSEWDGNDLTDPEIIELCRKAEADREAAASLDYPSYEGIDVTTPLTINEYNDNHWTTRNIAEGDSEGITIYYDRLGNAGSRCLLRF